MLRSSLRRPLLVVLALAALAAGAMASQGAGSHGSDLARRRPHHGGAAVRITVGAGAPGRVIPSGFVGLSTEYWAIPEFAGQDPTALDPVFEQLLRNLAPGQQPVLRIGGDSTDWTWWPVPGARKPPGIRYTLTARWMQITKALAEATNARLILGINLEADSRRLADAEARTLVDAVGRSSVLALEIGNEPELYASFGWYRTSRGREVPGRPRGYGIQSFTSDFSSFARSMPAIALAGPSTGSADWLPDLGQFLNRERRIGVATVHAYPLKHCTPASHVTIGQVLSDAASRGLAGTLAQLASTAHRHHVPLRIDEINSVSCGGERGVSDSYASALWALDSLFALARSGVDGINFHTPPRSTNQMFTFSRVNGAWRASVHPIYYGLLMFAQATPPGSRLIRVAGATIAGLSTWATHGRDGKTRIVIINKATHASRTVDIRAPAGATTGTVALLRAPNIAAKHGITLGGQSFGAQTGTGLLAGAPTIATLRPAAHHFFVRLPPGSAALVTVSTT